MSQSLLNISLPEISSTLNSAFQDLKSAQGTGGGIPNSVRQQFDPVIAQTDKDYAMAGRGQSAYIKQANLQSGNQMNQQGTNSLLQQAGMSLEQSRRGAQQNLAYEEASAGLTQYNQLLDIMGLGTGEAIGTAGSLMGLAGTSISALNPQSLGGSVMGGAASGASAGSFLGPWGTLIGGVIGGAAGAAGYGSY
jgi:hypothetical protein